MVKDMEKELKPGQMEKNIVEIGRIIKDADM